MNALLIPLAFMFFFSDGNRTLDDERLFMCQCMSVTRVDTDHAQLQKKDVYTFIVRGKDGRACYESKALKEYSGFYEMWHSDSWDHPSVFNRPDDSLVKMDSRMAQAFGLALENRQIKVTVEEQFESSPIVVQYFPELIGE